MSSPPPPPSVIGYSPQLDALRAFAVTAVLLNHFWLEQSFWGHWGVRLFFVLSGYLVTAILLDARDRITDSGGVWGIWKAFYIRRALRIFPAYYLLLAVVFFSSAEARADWPWHVFYGTNLLIALENDWGFRALAHLWSLSVEEQFYLVWPIVVLLVPRRWLLPLFVMLILSALGFRYALTSLDGGPIRYVLLPSALDVLVGGALLAELDRRGYLTWQNIRIIVGLGGLGIALYFLTAATAQDRATVYVLSGFFLALPMIAAVAVCRLGLPGLPGHVLEMPWLVYLGRISYGIYLFHYPVAWLLAHLLREADYLFPPAGLGQFVLASAATVIIAVLSFRFVEQPINGLKHRFRYTEPARA